MIPCSFYFTAFGCLCGAASASQPLLWPLPSTFIVSSKVALDVDGTSFAFTQPNSNSDLIHDAFDRYLALIFPHSPEGQPDPSVSSLTGLDVKIADASEDTLGFDMDESYTLSITASSSTGTLTANTVWGALRGLETFSQLIQFNITLNNYQCFSASIQDEPRFPHRGLLIDTSRHFQSVRSILSVLDSMSYAKLNVLHWHMVDSQSFPYESQAYPKLWDARYSSYEAFTQNDVKDVIAYAKARGIRVIVEFDMPGHANSWCKGYPEICPSESCESPLNPAVNATWDLISGLISEASQLFIDDHIHLGGDEVNTGCWTKTQSIVDWMNAQNLTALQALQYFDESAIDIANDNNLTVIDWDEVFSNFGDTLDTKKVVVQVWHSDDKLLPEVVASGFRAIYSPDPYWYLDQLSRTWQDRYVIEPLASISDADQQKLVIGGEACMWGETVDVSDIMQTIWPTAAAVAERLWSPREVNSTSDATPRIEWFRCFLNERGIAAAPTKNAGERQSPKGPGSCFEQ